MQFNASTDNPVQSSPVFDAIESLLSSQAVDVERYGAEATEAVRDGMLQEAQNSATLPPDTSPEVHVAKAVRSDPRKKLLHRLGQSGLLNGEASRRRQVQDLKDYPDIAALAHVAKTKEHFYEIMGSPQTGSAPAPKECHDFAPLAPAAKSGYSAVVSPASTSAGPDSSADEQPSPVMLPWSSAAGEVTCFDLNADTDVDSRASPTSSGRQPSKSSSRNTASPLPEPSRCVDPSRADLLWKLAGNGSPELKPLDTPELETDGSMKTGVYLLSSPKMGPSTAMPFQGIFKPLDEEVFERRGIEPGMGAVREEAAFVIDHATGGQAQVPTTARVSIEERGVRKKGSIQQFVEGSVGPVEDFGMPRELGHAEAIVGLDNAQAVACFDIRTFNTDRHSGNLLLAGMKPHKIVCIDHGCVLPAWWALESSRFDAWLDWPHVKAAPSPATMSLVTQVKSTLPGVVQELEKLGLPKQAVWTLEICTSLLEKCVLLHGLTLRSVALLMTRNDPAEPCWLERMVANACNAAGISAEFVPEGKYGDLALQVDQKIINNFTRPEGCAFDNKYLANFRDAFFLFLDGTFSHTDMISAAQAAEDAFRNPWD